MLSTLVKMVNLRKTNHKHDDMIDVSRSSGRAISCSKVSSDVSRYSGPDPQILPFPPELIARILAYVDRACDKRNARLACKGFAAAGLPSLTSKAYFSTSLIGIDYSSGVPHFSSPTSEIAMHPVVSKYITTMFCEGTQLSESFLDFTAFQSWWLTLSNSQTSWPLEKVHSIYTSRYAQEYSIIKDGEDQKIFCRALENFPKLDCVWFRDVITNGPQDWPRPTWPMNRPTRDFWSPSSPYHNFAMCIRLLSKMEIKLRELHIIGRDYPISLGMFVTASPTDHIHLLNVFENLRKLDLNVNTHQETYILNYDSFGSVLTHATKLQSLDLKCHGNVICQSRLVLSHLFRDFTWQHLRHIGLSGFRLYSDVDLIAFFHRHRATIDSVKFRYMFLHQPDTNSTVGKRCKAWKNFFDELRKREIKLRALCLYRIYDCRNSEFDKVKLDRRAEYGRKVLQYLNHGGTNPLEADPVKHHGCQG